MTGSKRRRWGFPSGLLGYAVVLLLIGFWDAAGAQDQPIRSADPTKPWVTLIQQAEALRLPTGFLKEIDPHFVTVQFADLHTYAAEYHPEDHRMILNLRLSFNKAGGALTALDRMTNHDLSLLYHELLHAYLDYVFFGPGPQALSPEANRLLGFAEEQLRCHYRFVRINPVRQRRDATDLRFLSKEDAWEALNETWAVFVGWAVWTKLELFRDAPSFGQWTEPVLNEWATRLTAANGQGDLLGYYEPDDPDERRIARKRFLAPSHGVTPQGARLLLEVVLEEQPAVVERGGRVIEAAQDTTAEKLPCD